MAGFKKGIKLIGFALDSKRKTWIATPKCQFIILSVHLPSSQMPHMLSSLFLKIVMCISYFCVYTQPLFPLIVYL